MPDPPPLPLESRDTRPWWWPRAFVSPVSRVRFGADAYETRGGRFGRWRRKDYAGDEVFRANGSVLRLRKIPLQWLGWTHTLWSLRPPVGTDVRALVRTLERTRRDALRRGNADVADPPLCFDCGYDREHLPPGHACPECGWRPAANGAYLLTVPRPGAGNRREQTTRPLWTRWVDFAAAGIMLGAFVVISLGPPRGLFVPRPLWTVACFVVGGAAIEVLRRRVAPATEPATLSRETLRIEPDADDARVLRVRTPGAFDAALPRRRVRLLRIERRLPNLYRLVRPLAWYKFGRKFEAHFTAAPDQAARVRAALERVGTPAPEGP